MVDSMEDEMEIIEGERCPLCLQNTLTLMERVLNIPHFGVTHMFSMHCENPDCDYHLADLEAEEDKKPVKDSLEISSEEHLQWYIVKSADATVKIPRMVELAPGPDSSGFISTIEGLLNRFKTILEELTQDDDKDVAKKAKNHLKKLNRVLWGRESIKIVLEDKSGNSSFIRERLEFEE